MPMTLHETEHCGTQSLCMITPPRTIRFPGATGRKVAINPTMKTNTTIAMAQNSAEIIQSNEGKFMVLAQCGENWRHGSESNRRIGLLQSPALPLGYRAISGSGSIRFCLTPESALPHALE